jgi:hypothetical protein
VYASNHLRTLNEYHTAEMTPSGCITVDWSGRHVAVAIDGVHLYNGEFGEVEVLTKVPSNLARDYFEVATPGQHQLRASAIFTALSVLFGAALPMLFLAVPCSICRQTDVRRRLAYGVYVSLGTIVCVTLALAVPTLTFQISYDQYSRAAIEWVKDFLCSFPFMGMVLTYMTCAVGGRIWLAALAVVEVFVEHTKNSRKNRTVKVLLFMFIVVLFCFWGLLQREFFKPALGGILELAASPQTSCGVDLHCKVGSGVKM